MAETTQKAQGRRKEVVGEVVRTKDRVQPIEYIAEAVYQLAIADPKKMTGRVAYAEPFLKELGVKPSELV